MRRQATSRCQASPPRSAPGGQRACSSRGSSRLRAALCGLCTLAFVCLVPLHAHAHFLVDAEQESDAGKWSAILGTGLDASPRLALGARWRISDELPRVEQPLTLSLALTSPIWLLPSGDHLGLVAGARYTLAPGPWRPDVSGWKGVQAWNNGVAKGSTWSFAGALLPGFHHRRSFVGARLGVRSAYLTRVSHLENWTRWVDAQDGWYGWTATSMDLTLRGGTRVGRMVRLEAEAGARLPFDFRPLVPFELPWIVGLRVVVVPH